MTKGLNMDIKQEITNHLQWIEAIVSRLGNEEITKDDIQAVTRHDNCALGQWLRSEASVKFKDALELEKLNQSHEAFHKLAGDLISDFQMGKEAETIESQEKLIEISRKIVSHLRILEEKASK